MCDSRICCCALSLCRDSTTPNYNGPATDLNLTASRGVISGWGGESNVSGAVSPLDPAGPRSFRTAVRVEF